MGARDEEERERARIVLELDVLVARVPETSALRATVLAILDRTAIAIQRITADSDEVAVFGDCDVRVRAIEARATNEILAAFDAFGGPPPPANSNGGDDGGAVPMWTFVYVRWRYVRRSQLTNRC